MSTVVAPPTNPSALTVGRAAEVFLDSLANPNTRRGYATAVGKTAAKLGEDRPLATVTDDEVGEALESLWVRRRWVLGTRAVRRWVRGCPGAGNGTRPRPCQGGASALRPRTPRLRCGPGWRSTGW
ncbi:hypothetical protein [Saccharopolyspora phatthalungensis]|uniref:Core-binding (CB) domain-containing protein n=1 Tax=Saccharopolyspora phatthalungensis TaxID=664693 RepID=A0A840QDV2_9PSEU|nr:hypothetical protein [Saccharopolyspora phatthalungensis]MBB5158187.1 hypothetical protein [Saccharopolyspora phatthalungensis]